MDSVAPIVFSGPDPYASATVAVVFVVAVLVLIAAILLLAVAALAWGKAITAALNVRLNAHQVAEHVAPTAEHDLEPEPHAARAPRTRTRMAEYTDEDLISANAHPVPGDDDLDPTAAERDVARGRVRTMDEHAGYNDEEEPIFGRPSSRV